MIDNPYTSERHPSFFSWGYAYLLGVFLARVSWLLFPIQLDQFQFYLSSPAILLMTWCAIRIAICWPQKISKKDSLCFVVCVGIVFDQLIYLIVREDSSFGAFGSVSLLGSFLIGAVFLIFSFLLSIRTGIETKDKDLTKPSTRVIILFVTIQFITILGYRFINIYMFENGIPNSDRSLMLSGFEIHHIVTGAIILAIGVSLIVFSRGSRVFYRVGFLMVSIGIPMVTDEWLYYSYSTVTDERYFELPSAASGLCLTTLMCVIFLLEVDRKRCKLKVQPEACNKIFDEYSFHKRYLRPWLFYIFPSIAILQLGLVIYSSYQYDLWTTQSTGLLAIQINDKTVVKGFLNDFFYITWNVFPLLLWANYMVLNRFGKQWLIEVLPLFGTERDREGIKWFHRVRDHWLVLVIIIIISAFAVYAQITKQHHFIDSKSFLYWWDWRISAFVYWTRFVALFFNMTLILLVFWKTLILLAELTWFTKKCDIKCQTLHPDNHCGLKPLGYLIYTLIVPWIIMAFVGVMGWLDHGTDQGIANLLGDTSMILFSSCTAALFFFLPSWYAHKQMKGDLDRTKVKLRDLINPSELEYLLKKEHYGVGENISNIPKRLNKSAFVLTLLRDLEKVSEWPFGLAQLAQVIVLIISPIFTFLKTYFRLLVELWFPS